jgi:hypothetical protein
MTRKKVKTNNVWLRSSIHPVTYRIQNNQKEAVVQPVLSSDPKQEQLQEAVEGNGTEAFGKY